MHQTKEARKELQLQSGKKSHTKVDHKKNSPSGNTRGLPGWERKEILLIKMILLLKNICLALSFCDLQERKDNLDVFSKVGISILLIIINHFI